MLPSLFTDNMVLQRDVTIPIWGTATPGGKITALFADEKKSTVANDQGQWQLNFPSQSAGGPFELKLTGKDTMTFTNVMVGEVWVCSGQSNMEMPLAGWGNILNYEQEIAEADYPDIRLFTVNRAMSLFPKSDVEAEPWAPCNPETIPLFSAAGYFFGRHLHKELDIPIGLIHTSWGGTPAEAWTSKEFLAELPDYAEAMTVLDSTLKTEDELVAEYEEQMAAWKQALDEKLAQTQMGAQNWENEDIDESTWGSMTLPVLWESAGLANFDGVVWFRKTFELPDVISGETFTLSMGPIDDQDITYINSRQVGTTDTYNTPREYSIPAGILKAGRNVIAVQILDTGGGGGIWGTAEQMYIKSASGTSIDLSGDWSYKVAVDLEDVPPRPQSPESPHRPTILYNAMLQPLIPYAIRGAIWYQGEANASRAYQYRELFPAMIRSWRDNWNQGDFPFLFVQLANFQQQRDMPVESEWAELREAQTMALDLPNTGMAVTIDIGDADDIHPKNKQDVGKRLALQALAQVYDYDIVNSGPLYRTYKIENDKIRLYFDHIGTGLIAKGGQTLQGFAVAGEDSNFVWAKAVIEDETVIVSSPNVPKPVAVRYAWADNPLCNLYNQEGLPASPFRTDDWRGITYDAK